MRWSVPAPAGARELGQDPGVGEPAHVVGVADEHRGAGRRAQHARWRHGRPDQAVDDRRLARSGRAADDREQRGVEAAQAGQHVVVELVDELGAGLPRAFGTGDVEREAGVRSRLAQGDQRGGEGARGPGRVRVGHRVADAVGRGRHVRARLRSGRGALLGRPARRHTGLMPRRQLPQPRRPRPLARFRPVRRVPAGAPRSPRSPHPPVRRLAAAREPESAARDASHSATRVGPRNAYHPHGWCTEGRAVRGRAPPRRERS